MQTIYLFLRSCVRVYVYVCVYLRLFTDTFSAKNITFCHFVLLFLS